MQRPFGSQQSTQWGDHGNLQNLVKRHPTIPNGIMEIGRHTWWEPFRWLARWLLLVWSVMVEKKILCLATLK